MFPIRMFTRHDMVGLRLSEMPQILLGTLQSPPQSLLDYSVPGRVLVVA